MRNAPAPAARRAPLGREVWMELKDKDKLKGYMLIQGNLTHRALAEGAGLGSHTYIGKLLRGKASTVTPGTAARISLFLGVGVDDLWIARTSREAQQAAEQYATLRAVKARNRKVAA